MVGLRVGGFCDLVSISSSNTRVARRKLQTLLFNIKNTKFIISTILQTSIFDIKNMKFII